MPNSTRSARSVRSIRSAPARVPQPPQSVNTRVRRWLATARTPGPRRTGRISEPFSEIMATVKSSLRRPAFVLLLVIAIAFIFAHGDKTGPIHKLCRDSPSAICKFATANSDKVLGIVIFIVTAWDAPRSMSAQVMIASIFWVVLVPEPGLWAYAIQAFLLHTFLWVRTDSAKLVVLALAALAYALDYIPLFETSKLKSRTS